MAMKMSGSDSHGGKRNRDESGHGGLPSPASGHQWSGASPVPTWVRIMQEKQEAEKGESVFETAAVEGGQGLSLKKKAAAAVEEEAEGREKKSEMAADERESLCWKCLSRSILPALSKVAVVPFPTPARRLHPRPRHILSESSEEEDNDEDDPGLPLAREQKSAPASVVVVEEEKVAPVVRLALTLPAPVPAKKRSVRGKSQRIVDTSDDDWEKDEVKRKRAKRKEVTKKRAETTRKNTVNRTRKLLIVTDEEDGNASRMCDLCRRNNGEEDVYCQECKFHLCFTCLDRHNCSRSN